MHIEQLEVIDFLKGCSPLDLLPEEQLITLAQHVETIYQRAGQTILTAGKENYEVFLIRKGSIIFKNLNARTEIQLDVGAWFGHSAMFQKGFMQSNVESNEDSLLYVFPAEVIRTLMSENESIQNYFSENKASRLKQAVSNYRGDGQTQLISSQIEDIKLRASLSIASDTTIIEAAQLMGKEKRTAVLIIDDNELKGIATEREFCQKVVANGLDIQRPITDVMTANPITVSGSMSAANALTMMAKKNIHHLPFQRQSGEFSTITASDLIQFQSHNPLFLITDIYGALTIDELVRHARKIPALLTDLVNSSLAAYDIGHLISSVGEAINQRLIQLAEMQLGEPPVEYAWLVAGSQGRMEQTAFSDQDNALLLSNDYIPEKHHAYFKALAKFVCDGLNQCGYIYCPGNIMATNPEWQLTVDEWHAKYMNWVRQPEPDALLYSTVFFDVRAIYGQAELLDNVLPKVLQQTGEHAPFIAQIAANALQFSPPLGLFRKFVLEKSGAEEKALSLKQRGVVPVTDFARTYALAGGIAALNTEDRLVAAASAGLISEQGKNDLVDAYEFISTVRLRHQCKQIEAGLSPDNFVSPEMLSSLERQHLKDAFDVVNTMQKHLRHRY